MISQNKGKAVCVFCGASSQSNPVYLPAVIQLAHVLVEHGLTLVYGGASIGLMNTIAETVLNLNGHVIGIMPAMLHGREITKESVSELFIVDSLHERKLKMAALSDAFISLPGGIGTMDEMFEMWTLSQLGVHKKPCGLLNVENYFDRLIAFIKQMEQDRFISKADRKLLVTHTEPVGLLQALNLV